MLFNGNSFDTDEYANLINSKLLGLMNKHALISGMRFQYFVLRFQFDSLKHRSFRFSFAELNCGVGLVSVLSFNGTCKRLEVET